MPSILAEKCCNLNQIIITDKFDDNQKLFAMVNKTIELNKSNKCILKHLDWTKFDLDCLTNLPKIDFIIGSDIFFSGKLFEGIYSINKLDLINQH